MQRPDTESTLFSVFKTTKAFKVVDIMLMTDNLDKLLVF